MTHITHRKLQRLFVGICLLLTFAILTVALSHAQTHMPGAQDKQGRQPTLSWPGTTVWSPTDLGMNAVTLPISGDTRYSNVINTQGMKSLSVFFNCDQIIDLRMQYYAEDGVTILNPGGNAMVTGSAVGPQAWYMATEADTNKTSGTIGVAVRMPMRAMSFSLRNTTATAGTCTMRAFGSY